MYERFMKVTVTGLVTSRSSYHILTTNITLNFWEISLKRNLIKSNMITLHYNPLIDRPRFFNIHCIGRTSLFANQPQNAPKRCSINTFIIIQCFQCQRVYRRTCMSNASVKHTPDRSPFLIYFNS